MKAYTAICFWALLLIATSCGTIHEYPDCDDDVAKFSLAFEFNKEDIDEIIHNPTLRMQPLAQFADRQVRYTLEIYSASDDVRVAKEYIYTSDFVNYEVALPFELPVGNYYALAWADYVLAGNTNNLFYNTETLTDVSLLHSRGYDKSKLQFAGRKDFRLSSSTENISQKEVVTMNRLGGKFRIIATDYDIYLASGKPQPQLVAYSYHKSVYDRFNVYTDSPSTLKDHITLDGEITEFGGNECIVLLDWVILQKNGGTVEVSFTIYDANGDMINEIPPIQFPMKRDVITIIKGKFLTHQFRNEGIGIDDEFEKEIEIILP